MEPGDLHEEPAGERVARAVAGAGVPVRDSASGQWAIVSGQRGILRITIPLLAAVNGLEGVSVYTLFDGQVVDAGEVVARAKVTPSSSPRAWSATSRSAAGGAGRAWRAGFRGSPVGAVAPASFAPRARTRFETVLREKFDWFGAPLAGSRIRRPRPGPGAGRRGVHRRRRRIVVVAGADALVPLDPVFTAIERLGGRVVRNGVPAHPGSLLWVARVGSAPVLGMPGCGMFSQATLFDLLLPRLLAGENSARRSSPRTVTAASSARDGVPVPPYRAGRDRGTLPE